MGVLHLDRRIENFEHPPGADQRLLQLGLPRRFGAKNPFAFMELQDVQELTNFFERTTSSYQVGVEGEVTFDDDF